MNRSPLTTAAGHVDALRDELGISIPELAEMVDGDYTTLWRVLRGKTVRPRADLVGRCLVVLGQVMQSAAGGRVA